jgi:DNA-binding MarR family transcriptional regulator
MKRRFNPWASRRPPAISPLDAHLSYWVRCVSNELSHSLGRRLEHKGITLAEWVVLRELYDGERRPSALAEKLGLTRGAISKLAGRL